jgi:hypothetical protein
MKAKLSGLSCAVTRIVTIVTVLLVVVSGSAPTACVAMVLGAQGGGRPTPKPKRTLVRRTKSSTPRSRSTPPIAKANDANKEASDRNVGSNISANSSGNPPSIVPVSNVNNSNSVNPSPLPILPGTSTQTSPANKTTDVPVTWNGRFLNDPTQPDPNPEADILLPQDFSKLVGAGIIGIVGKEVIVPPLSAPWGIESEPKKALFTTGTFSEISNKRKVFVNVTGKAGAKIAARLREYGGLEVVQTAREAEFAVHFYNDSRDVVDENGIQHTITNGLGMMIITIRAPSQGLPSIVWQNADRDGGEWFKSGEAFDKLARRFILELKKLRGEK